MERHRAEDYAVGGWRSAALEVGGTRQRSEVRDQPPSLKLRRAKEDREGVLEN